MGGGSTTVEVVREFLGACGGPESLVVVMPQTREEPWRGTSSVELLEENGAKNVVLLGHDVVIAMDREKAGELLRSAKGVWIPGGDQRRFIDRWGVEWLRTEFRAALNRGVNFFGTSAGAMIMSDPMISGPGKEEKTVEIRPGIGLFDGLIDTHFRERSREARLEHGLGQVGHRRALGLSEGEWVVVWKGQVVKKVGEPLIQGVGQ
jgi:cyanophycinase